MTQKQQIEDIIKLKSHLIIRNKETLYLLDKNQIKEIVEMIVKAKEE